jgi:protein-L-isoaspartate(D-aspartate) O-methyltransferase
MQSLEKFREFYARYIAASVGVRDERIVEAFTSVRREDFLPPGPWQVRVPDGYVATPNADPALLYQISCGIIPAGGSTMASLVSMRAASLRSHPARRDPAYRLRLGYYTAICRACPHGHVTGVEVVAELAEQPAHRASRRCN